MMHSLFDPSTPFGAIFYNVVGGVLAAAIFWAIESLRRAYALRSFRKFFGGCAADGTLYLVLPIFKLRPKIVTAIRRSGMHESEAFRKPDDDSHNHGVPELLAQADAKGLSYISELLGKYNHGGMRIVTDSDHEVRSSSNLSLITFGLGSNSKTCAILDDPAYQGPYKYNQDRNSFEDPNKENAPWLNDDEGIIARIRPTQHPGHVWFICAGLRHKATAAAGWYLANKWTDLRDHPDQSGVKVGEQNFIAKIAIAENQLDESTQLKEVVTW